MEDFWTFLAEHADADPVRLLLSQREWPVLPSELSELEGRISARDLAVNTLEARRKLRKKLPAWAERADLVYPVPLSAEQCSSEQTARYKAQVAAAGTGEAVAAHLAAAGTQAPASARPAPAGTQAVAAEARETATDARREPLRIADLTGGLGVDARAFREVAGEVLYNDMNPLLAAAARHNFPKLGCPDIRIRNRELKPGNLKEILDGFQPDVIFLDPARRAGDGRKVFRLEDCAPDVLQLLPELFRACRHLLLKLSPMADISLLARQFGAAAETTGLPGTPVREVHVVASGGECKELLLLLDREYAGAYSLHCVEDGHVLAFGPSETQPACRYPADAAEVAGWLFEPGKSLTKAGVFNGICGRFGLVKLGRHTHLYLAPEPSETLKPFGNLFKIKEIFPLNKQTMKAASERRPRADVTARNIPMASEELAKRMQVTPGGDLHLFGVRIDSATHAGNYLLVCERI